MYRYSRIVGIEMTVLPSSVFVVENKITSKTSSQCSASKLAAEIGRGLSFPSSSPPSAVLQARPVHESRPRARCYAFLVKLKNSETKLPCLRHSQNLFQISL